jgi:hypothetical protein
MKTIGLIGGMSWESSAEYYRIINDEVKARLGGFHSAKCVMISVDFAEIEILQHQGRWQDAAELLAGAARSLELAGADFVVLCTNTMHKLAQEIEASINIPFLHIADATAQVVRAVGVKKIGLLGMRFTMEEAFYTHRPAKRLDDPALAGSADPGAGRTGYSDGARHPWAAGGAGHAAALCGGRPGERRAGGRGGVFGVPAGVHALPGLGPGIPAAVADEAIKWYP